MSFQQCIPWQVALQQSLPPLPLLRPSSTTTARLPTNFRRTATVPELGCLISRRKPPTHGPRPTDPDVDPAGEAGQPRMNGITPMKKSVSFDLGLSTGKRGPDCGFGWLTLGHRCWMGSSGRRRPHGRPDRVQEERLLRRCRYAGRPFGSRSSCGTWKSGFIAAGGGVGDSSWRPPGRGRRLTGGPTRFDRVWDTSGFFSGYGRGSEGVASNDATRTVSCVPRY